jgi:hypothetical protein
LWKGAAEAVVVQSASTRPPRVAETETELQRLAEAVMDTASGLKAEQERLDQARELEPLHKRRQALTITSWAFPSANAEHTPAMPPPTTATASRGASIAPPAR